MLSPTSDFESDRLPSAEQAVLACERHERLLRVFHPNYPNTTASEPKNKKTSGRTRGTLVLVVGLEPTCCLQHRILSPTGCPQPSKQPLLANALASMPSPDLGETRASFASIPPKLPEHYRFRAAKTKKPRAKPEAHWCWWWDLNPHVVSNIGF